MKTLIPRFFNSDIKIEGFIDVIQKKAYSIYNELGVTRVFTLDNYSVKLMEDHKNNSQIKRAILKGNLK